MDTPLPASGAQAREVQPQAILEAHPGQGQDPGPRVQGLDEPPFGIRFGPGRFARPGRGPREVPLPERHLAEPDPPGAEGQPGPGIRGELAQGCENFIPEVPGDPLGEGHETRRGGRGEADVFGPTAHQISRFPPDGHRDALEVLLPAHFPGLELLLHEGTGHPHAGPGHGAFGAVHDPEVVRVQVEERRVEGRGAHPLPAASSTFRPTG